MLLESFAVLPAPGEIRAAVERHAASLLDRAAPYARFGAPLWSAP